MISILLQNGEIYFGTAIEERDREISDSLIVRFGGFISHEVLLQYRGISSVIHVRNFTLVLRVASTGELSRIAWVAMFRRELKVLFRALHYMMRILRSDLVQGRIVPTSSGMGQKGGFGCGIAFIARYFSSELCGRRISIPFLSLTVAKLPLFLLVTLRIV